MLSGFILPGGDATKQLELALVAEDAGWDGVFVWEGGYGVDAWTLLAAIAARTGRVRLGTMLTPLPWRRPWKVASQVATLDQLSGGRAILTVEAGRHHGRLPAHRRGEDLRVRAAMLDDGIDLIRALWEGRAEFGGERFRYRFEATDQLEVARPVQDRLPIWVVGLWPRMRSMRRVLRCEGSRPSSRESTVALPNAFGRCAPGPPRTTRGLTSMCWPRAEPRPTMPRKRAAS